MEIVESAYTTLRAIDKDEAWLEQWDPRETFSTRTR